jgi:YVTN family beta-propeller protein
MRIFPAIGAVCVLSGFLLSQPAARVQVGPLASGGFLLNSGWKLSPAGTQVEVGTFPMSTALSNDGRYLLVLNGGTAPPSISVIRVADRKEVSRTPIKDGWLGLAFNPKGDHVYAGGGSQAGVLEFAFADGHLTSPRMFPAVDPAKRTDDDFIGDVCFSPDGRMLYAADVYQDSLAIINPLTGFVVDHVKTGRRPYRILFAPDGKSYFVTSWADGTLTEYSASDNSITTTIRLGSHPTDMIWRHGANGDRIYIAAANTNSVFGVTVSEGGLEHAETINIAMTPLQPLGMTPSALALSSDAKTLYVVCSNANAVAQVDLSQEKTVLTGFIPVGWYPTAVRALSAGTVVVVNGRGLGSHANPMGPNPTKAVARAHRADDPTYQYVAFIQKGTVSFIAPPTPDQLNTYSDTVIANAAYNDGKLAAKPALPAGIKHAIFIVKENRTYDQVLGDMREGNGDPSLVLFGENVTPNLHKLAREFVLLDNFYVNADVSADGHNWSTSAIANDYVEKMWPNNYGGRRKTYSFEGGEPAALPPAGFLWNNAHMAGVSMRNYGYWTKNKATAAADGTQIDKVYDPQLVPVTDMRYRGFDLDYPDVERAKEFIRELQGFEKSGSMPQLLFVRMGNDHTSGLAPGKIAPLSAAADNDLAVGMLIEALSKSRFWAESAVFIVEDDAQNGPDHVDSHRSPAFVISPFVRRHQVDSTMYNTTSILRTMELLLGIRPMTQFDAGATAMSAVFQMSPDTSAYTAEQPKTPLNVRNSARAGSGAEAHLDLRDADLNDDAEMNAELWRAIKGNSIVAHR